MEERDGGVDEERVPREAKTDDPVGRLEKATASDDPQQLLALVENYFEPNRHEPKHQGSQEESPSLVLILRCSSHHSPLSLALWPRRTQRQPATDFLGDSNIQFVTDRKGLLPKPANL